MRRDQEFIGGRKKRKRGEWSSTTTNDGEDSDEKRLGWVLAPLSKNN